MYRRVAHRCRLAFLGSAHTDSSEEKIMSQLTLRQKPWIPPRLAWVGLLTLTVWHR